MKYGISIAVVLSAVLAGLLAAVSSAFALDGQIGIHDPSTIGVSDGKYFAFGTGGNGIMSDDGWTWRSGAVRPNGGVAPDVCKIGDRYLVSYGGVFTMWTKSLDPQSPDFGFSEPIQIARSEGSELNAIDSSLLLDPNDGRLWMTMGSYVGYIRLYELDPKTGGKLNDQYTNIAINCEASEMIYHDGWYYLFGNKNSCCAGSSSGYNIRMGRAIKPSGPFIDNMRNDMMQGGGKLFASATGRWVGPGHFGLLDLGDGVQKWSCHYEADLDRGGQSVLDIRPLWYKDGWPVAGSNILKETTFKISTSLGAALQPTGGVAGNGEFVISPVANVGGYPGMPFVKITMGGSKSVLAINAAKELVTAPEFTGAPEQLWRLDQLIDGTWRIMPRTLSDKEGLALVANSGTATSLAKYEFKNDNQHWTLTSPEDPKVLKDGNYEIESARTGRALEIAVEGLPVGGGRGARGGGGGAGGGGAGAARAGGVGGAGGGNQAGAQAGAAAAGGAAGGAPGAGRGAPGAGRGAPGAGRGAPGAGRGGGGGLGRGGGAPIPDQDPAVVSVNWPKGNVDARLANYMCEAQQKWSVQPVADSGGLYKVVVAGTTRTLAATTDRDLIVLPSFTGGPEQLWRLDKLDDGTWRISPGSSSPEGLALSSIGTGGVTLSRFDPNSDKQHWNVKTP